MAKLTREQAAVIGLFTGVACGPFEDIHKLAEELVGHPVFTHQFADAAFADRLKELARPRFIALCPDREIA